MARGRRGAGSGRPARPSTSRACGGLRSGRTGFVGRSLNGLPTSSGLDAEGELAEVVLLELAVRLRRLLEPVDAAELDVERAGGDELVQALEGLARGLPVVGLRRDALRALGGRLDAVRVRHPPALPHLGDGRVGSGPAREDERGVEAAGGELVHGARYVVLLPVEGAVGSELLHERDAVRAL